MNSVEIRPILESERPAAIELLLLLNPDTAPELVGERFERILAEHPHYLPVGAFEDGRMTGFIGAWFGTRVWCGRYLEADNFIVRPDRRGSGLGSRMMAYLEDLARERGCEVVALDTYTSLHSAHRLYHRLGYSILGYHFIKQLEP